MPWTSSNPTWAQLDPYQRAAAMALMEANSGKSQAADATNVIGAMVNRAKMGNEDLGAHVGRTIYQPTFEPAQQARLPSIIGNPNFPILTKFARDRWEGNVEDPVKGATHFLAPEPTMRALTAREPNKYRSWTGWTGYGKDQPGQYSNPDRAPVFRDASHAFLYPEGAYSAPGARPPASTGPEQAPEGGLEPLSLLPSAPPAPAATPFIASGPAPGGALDLSGLKLPQQADNGMGSLLKAAAAPFAKDSVGAARGIDDSASVKAANEASMNWWQQKRKSQFAGMGAA